MKLWKKITACVVSLTTFGLIAYKALAKDPNMFDRLTTSNGTEISSSLGFGYGDRNGKADANGKITLDYEYGGDNNFHFEAKLGYSGIVSETKTSTPFGLRAGVTGRGRESALALGLGYNGSSNKDTINETKTPYWYIEWAPHLGKNFGVAAKYEGSFLSSDKIKGTDVNTVKNNLEAEMRSSPGFEKKTGLIWRVYGDKKYKEFKKDMVETEMDGRKGHVVLNDSDSYSGGLGAGYRLSGVTVIGEGSYGERDYKKFRTSDVGAKLTTGVDLGKFELSLSGTFNRNKNINTGIQSDRYGVFLGVSVSN